MLSGVEIGYRANIVVCHFYVRSSTFLSKNKVERVKIVKRVKGVEKGERVKIVEIVEIFLLDCLP